MENEVKVGELCLTGELLLERIRLRVGGERRLDGDGDLFIPLAKKTLITFPSSVLPSTIKLEILGMRNYF